MVLFASCFVSCIIPSAAHRIIVSGHSAALEFIDILTVFLHPLVCSSMQIFGNDYKG